MAALANVADVPGVPPLNFVPGAELGIELLSSDGVLGLQSAGSQWGIYSGGSQIVQADSVVDFALKKEWALSDAPQEQGAFQTYDKVILPYDARVRFAAGGSLANRAALLASVDAIAGSLSLFDVVTPENVYTSANIVHYDYKRTSQNGVGLIVVDVWLFQVRVVSSSSSGGGNADTGTPTGDTAAPSGADPQNGGTVQTTPPTQGQTDSGSSSTSIHPGTGMIPYDPAIDG